MEKLIYTDQERNDIGYLNSFSLDLENGKDNDFELVLPLSEFSKLRPDCFIYVENNPQYGGRIDSYNPVAASNVVKFKGRTWRGIFSQKILLSNVSYASYSVLSDIIQHTINLSDFNDSFVTTENNATIGTTNQIGIYTTPLSALETIFGFIGCRPSFVYDPTVRKIKIGAEAIVDYSVQEFGTDKVNLDININSKPINHVVAITNSGAVKHRYLLYNGTQSTSLQDYKGSNEIMHYMTVSGTNETEIQEAMAEVINNSVAAATTCAVTLSSFSADIGDIVGGTDKITGVFAAAKVVSKILKMDKFTSIVNLETGA